MEEFLKKSIQEKHPILTSVFERNWSKTLKEFSTLLYNKTRSLQVDPLLISAFHEEFRRLKLKEPVADLYVSELEASPILQTAHHVTPANGPTFLATDVISLAGLPAKKTYFVGAISGLPFSNPALSGSLLFESSELNEVIDPSTREFKDALLASQDDRGLNNARRSSVVQSKKVTVIPSRMRNGLVYSSKVPQRLLSLWPALTPNCREVLTAPETDESYSSWACRSCAGIQRLILQKDDIIYFDINRVVANYLLKAIESKQHVLNDLLFDLVYYEKLVTAFAEPTLFLRCEDPGDTPRVIALKGTTAGIFDEATGSLVPRESLVAGLKSGTICPSMFPILLALRFLNGFRCFGGYLQVDYLEAQRKTWQDLCFPFAFDLESDSDAALTTGRIIDNGVQLFALDVALSKGTISLPELYDRPMSELWTPIANHLASQ